jgi:toxin ParE1/3/4
MKSLRRSDDFNADVRREWVYLHQFGEALADRFIDRVEESLQLLARQPGVGHPGRYRHRRLAGLRVWAVARPFGDWLMFYWDRPEHVDLFRLMHGARDLTRRLAEDQPSD